MKKFFENRYIYLFSRAILGGLFMYASFDKMANPEAFANIIDNYHILPYQLVNPMAIFLPWLEFITGLLLVVGKWVKGSLLIYSSLLIIFIIALAQAVVRGLDISCGCFSVQSSSTSDIWVRIILDIVMLFFSVNLFKYSEVNNSEYQTDIKTENPVI
jgi:uncharacterized membrane protein YphA (DoxX/SURF4 family)